MNTVLFKVDDTHGGGGFSLRFLDQAGRPVDLQAMNPLDDGP